VVRVLVDDNNRVHKGDLLVQLDKEPYQVKVEIAQAAVGVAQADLVSAQAKDQSLAGLAHSERYDMTHAIEDLKNQVAELHASVAALQAAEATLIKTRADFERARALFEPRSSRAMRSMRSRNRIRSQRRRCRRRSRMSTGFAPSSAFRLRPRVKTWRRCHPTSTKPSPR
jgi:membrane fusion protein (multidrug efflux system)